MTENNKYISQVCSLVRNCIVFSVILMLVSSCEKWYDTKEVSHVSTFPRFEIIDGDFQSFIIRDSGEYEDPGAMAYDGDKPLPVYSVGDVDLTKIGVYFIKYYAQNEYNVFSIGERVVSVTRNDVSRRDLSGIYEGTLWEPLTQMKVERIDSGGLYKCSEVFGYPGAKMKGRFVDLGKNQLILLHGTGDFGDYASVGGTYDLTSLSWTIYLTQGSYAGLGFPVEWKKVEEK